MTRDDYIWVAVRIFGLLFLYKAVIALLGVGRLVVLTSTLALVLSSSRAETPYDLLSLMSEFTKAQAITTPVELLIYGLAAWYVLKGAPVVTRFIARYGKESEAP